MPRADSGLSIINNFYLAAIFVFLNPFKRKPFIGLSSFQYIFECEKYIRKTGRFIRWGGKEFVVPAPETNLSGLMHMAEKLRQLIEAHPPENAPAVTASFGIAEYYVGSFIKRADDALLRAKEKG